MDKNIVNFIAVGDVTLGDHPVCFGHGVRSTIEKYGFDFLFKNILQELIGADILFGNLETVLTADAADSNRLDSVEFRGKIAFANDLARTGFNVMSVANNHAMQHGAGAFEDTVRVLMSNNITPVGISENGESNCSYFQSGNVKIAIIAYSLRPDDYADTDIRYAVGNKKQVCEQAERLKAEGRVVIVSLHWGEEYLHRPSIEQVCLAHELIDSGCDLIIGHHPHVLQGIESYKHGHIVYSLGNFIADFWQQYARKTMIFKCSIDKNGISNIGYVPVMINRQYQPEVPDDNERQLILSEIEACHDQIPECDNAGLNEAMNHYQQEAAQAYLKYRKESYMYFLRNIYRYSFSTIAFSGARFIARRLGFG